MKVEVSEKELEALKAANQKSIAEAELMKAALGKENKELKQRVADLSVALDDERSRNVQVMSHACAQFMTVFTSQMCLHL